MTGTQRWFRRARRGQSLVEFAMVVPILLFLFMGIIEFARIYNAWQVITDAAREGARRAVVNDITMTDTSMVRIVVDSALARAGLTGTHSVTVTNFHTTFGEPTTVAVSYDYTFWVLGSFLSGTGVTLSTSTVMRQE